MAQRKGYSRLFIILQEQEKGYGLARDKEPNGYVKLESKNGKSKICFYVQNLRGTEKYSMILITNSKAGNKILNLGEPTFDSKGRVDLTIEEPAENIAKTGVAIDKIDGAAIAIVGDNTVVPVISGFASKDVNENWTSFQVVNSERARKVPVLELNREEEKFEKDDKEREKKDISKKDINFFEKYEKEISSKARDEDSSLEEIDDVEEENVEDNGEEREELYKSGFDVNADDKSQVNYEEIEEDYRDCDCKLKGSIGEYFTYLTEGLEEVSDIMPEIKNVIWYKVPVSDMEDLYSTTDYRKYTVIYYPMVANYPYISKHGHYYIGYKHDKNKNLKHLIYAVPGTKKIHDQPFGGKTGYVSWVAMESDRDDDTLGCWLMFYCFKTSTILIPME